MMPYNFAQENYFKTGYIAEGITTYYGDYMLARSGVFTTSQYFEELNTTLQRYFADYSRNNLSLADSSFDLWLDGYKPGIPDRKVSIYIKGALTALLLDLQLRKITENQKSLDSVMRILWDQFGKQNIGYTEQDYANIISEVVGKPFDDYFEKYINGVEPLEPALHDALEYVGYKLTQTDSHLINESKYGFKISVSNNVSKIVAIAPNSPASQALSIDDELIAYNKTKIESNLQQLLMLDSDAIELTLFRNNCLRTIKLHPDNQAYYTKFTIEKDADATYEQRSNFEQWLGCKF
jgi:predicted metalloprotease with PDZ domain